MCVCLSFCHSRLVSPASLAFSRALPPPSSLDDQTVYRTLSTTYGFEMPSLPLALVSFLLGL